MIQKRNDKFMLGSKLKTLLAVVDTGNFTRAAAQLYMTQPAVSHHIRQLEEEVGAPLIIRSKLGLRLTTQGEIVVKYARRMNALNEKMRQELQSAGRRLSVLRIGITHTSESNQTAAVLAPQGLSPAPCLRGKLLQGVLSAALAAILAPWVMG